MGEVNRWAAGDGALKRSIVGNGWTCGAAAVLALAIVRAAPARPSADHEPGLATRAQRLHEEAIVVDGHNDVTTFILDFGFDLGMEGAGPDKKDPTLYWIGAIRWLLPDVDGGDLRMDTDLERLRAGGVDAQFFSIFVDSDYVPSRPSKAGRAKQRALDMIDAVYEQLRRHPDDLELAISAADVRRIVAAGRVAALMGLEGGHAIEDDLENLREFADLGIRYMTLTWNNANSWADSCYEHPHGGLTDFGRAVVREMNRLGVMVDISHVSDETFLDAIDVTRAPVIASHSASRALADHPRNMSDEMLRAVARNGGVIMVNFQDVFIDPAKTPPWGALRFALRHVGWPDTPLSVLIDHIAHVAEVAGIDHVGLGSDFAGTFLMPEGIKDVSGFPNITLELLERGYSEEDLRKILGENMLRVMSDVESVGRLMREDENPAPHQGAAAARPQLLPTRHQLWSSSRPHRHGRRARPAAGR